MFLKLGKVIVIIAIVITSISFAFSKLLDFTNLKPTGLLFTVEAGDGGIQ